MPTLLNNAEGGTNGANVTMDTSGGVSGSVWDLVTLGTGAAVTFSNTKARGSLSYQFTTTATASTCFTTWNTAYETASLTTYTRIYLYLPSYPTGSVRLTELANGSGFCMSIGMQNTGRLSIRDSAGTSMGASTVVLPVGRWLRIESKCVNSTTTGQCEVRIYTDADSPYYVEKIVSSASFNTQATPADTLRVGLASLNIANYNYLIDGVGMTDVGYLGPADQTVMAPLQRFNTAEGGTDGVGVTTSNTDGTSGIFFNSVQVSGPSEITFSSARSAHGTKSYLFQPTTGNKAMFIWTGFSAPAAAVRLYLYLTAYPPLANTTELIQLNSYVATVQTLLSRVYLDSSGQLNFMDSSGTILWTSTSGLALSTWIRLELSSTIGGAPTTGSAQFAYYTGDGGTAVDSFTTSSANLGSGNFTQLRLGKLNSNTWVAPFNLDDIALSIGSSSFIGAYSGPAPTPPAAYAGIIPYKGWGTQI